VTRPGLEGLTIRAALVLGFSLTLGLWLFAGYNISQRMTMLRADAADLNSRYTRAQDLLSTVRAQVLLGSVYVRDALLDPSAEAAEVSLRRLAETSAAIDAALAQYVPVFQGNQAEGERLARLRREVLDFRMTMNEVLATDRSTWPKGARQLLNQRVVPRRQTVIQVSEDVQALNRQAFVEQQSRVAAVYDTAERRAWERFGLALAGSLGIALFATSYAGRLEARLRRQRETERHNAEDLQRLSAKLITVQEEERRAIARELHDEVGQVLTAVKMELSVAQRTIDAAGVPGRPLDDAHTITDSALNAVRDLSRLLHPALLDDLGLAAAVDASVKGFRRRHGIAVDLETKGLEARLPPPVEAAAYRIIQESLTNLARHAHAKRCRIVIEYSLDLLTISVQDDGVGMHRAEAEHGGASRGLGLISMRERVAQFGGTLAVQTLPGHGTTITARIPAAPAEAAAPRTQGAIFTDS
jgi:signal transduction histidine kinase